MRPFDYPALSLPSLFYCFCLSFLLSSTALSPSVRLGAGQLPWSLLSQHTCHLFLALGAHLLEPRKPCRTCKVWSLGITAHPLLPPSQPQPLSTSSLPTGIIFPCQPCLNPHCLVLLKSALLEWVHVRCNDFLSAYSNIQDKAAEDLAPTFFPLTTLRYRIANFFCFFPPTTQL